MGAQKGEHVNIPGFWAGTRPVPTLDALAVKAAGNRAINRIITLSRGKLDPVSADIALNNYTYEDLEKFFTELHNFEQHLSALVGREISLASVQFIFEPNAKHNTIAIQPNRGILRINAAEYTNLLARINYNLAHEYGHFLCSIKDFVEPSLPEDLRSERGPTWWFDERNVAMLVLLALINEEGLNHPFFGVIKIEGGFSKKALGGEKLIIGILDLLAHRAGSIITDNEDAYCAQELASLEIVYEACKKLHSEDLYYLAAEIASYYVWAKMRNHEELAAQFKELIWRFPENMREAFNELSNNLIALWMSFDEQTKPREPVIIDHNAQRAL